MSACLLRVVGVPGAVLSGRDPSESLGLYVASIDVDAYDGQGYAVLTADLDDARHFATAIDAMHYWRRPSVVRPTRGDGLTNRPGCAYTVEVVRA